MKQICNNEMKFLRRWILGITSGQRQVSTDAGENAPRESACPCGHGQADLQGKYAACAAQTLRG